MSSSVVLVFVTNLQLYIPQIQRRARIVVLRTEWWNRHAANRVVLFLCSAVTISDVALHLFAAVVELNKSSATLCLRV